MKLWDKGIDTDKLIETFTVGKDRELDVELAAFDVLGSIAHITMLKKINLLTADELMVLTKELQSIYKEIEQGNFTIEDGIEDVHSQVELLLTRRLGEVGKKIHSGRSRNDQVLLDLKLYIRHRIETLSNQVQELVKQLLELSNKYKDVLIPGYTHLQIAMPSSFGLWFGAYAESLTDDLILLQAAYKIANQNPLGSAAGYGSSFPLDREMTTMLLGFDSLNYNVVYAQMGRGKAERTVSYALASIGSTLSKMSMDACLYMSQNFSFISFPDELTTGSSIMPHKKNPDVFELIRARGNRMQSLPNEIALTIGNLPSGYHRDLQLIKESFMPAFDDLSSCIEVFKLMMSNIIVKQDIVKDEKYKYIFSVEEVNKAVLNGVPFRDAYKQIAGEIANNNFNPSTEVEHTHAGSIGNLCNDKILMKMNKIINDFCFDVPKIAFEKLLKS